MMPTRFKSAILHAVADYLLALGEIPQPFAVVIKSGEESHRLSCRLWPQAETPPTSTANSTQSGLWLSLMERRIVEALASGQWMPTREIAAKIGEEPDGDIRVVLRNLAEREVVECLQSRGYRLRRNDSSQGRE